MSDARSTIRCPICGSYRQVTPRQYRRARSEGGIPCTACRGGSEARQHNDSDLRYWLSAFGTEAAPRTPVRQFIAAGGAPPELVELAQSIFPR